MKRPVLSLCATLAAFLFPTIGQAEVPPKVKTNNKAEAKKVEPATPIESAIQSLTTALQNNTKTLAEIKKSMVTRKDLDDEVSKQVSSAVATKADKMDVSSLQARLKAQEEELKRLRMTLGELTRLVNAQGKDQQALLDTLASQDKDGNRIVSLSNMVDKSPKFKQELKAFVRKTQINAGTLEISNETRYDQIILVNQRRFRIPANTRSFRITVPVGVIVTELVGQEAPRRWVIDTPNKTRRIRIQPARQVSLRPAVVRPRLFVRRPVLYSPTYILP